MSETSEMLATAINTIHKLTAERDALLAACKATLAAIEDADLDGVTLWIPAPHQGPGVHESASERLAAAIAMTEGKE